MSVPLNFTDSEIAEIIQKRQAGATYEALAEQHYCSGQTIGNILRRHGLGGHKLRKPKYPIDKILADWNSGMDSRKITAKYEMSCPVHNYIAIWRKRGMPFAIRTNRAG